MTIEGGQKPYTVVLSALDSPIITNITMGPEDSIFTYIDRADPNGQLMGEYLYNLFGVGEAHFLPYL